MRLLPRAWARVYVGQGKSGNGAPGEERLNTRGKLMEYIAGKMP